MIKRQWLKLVAAALIACTMTAVAADSAAVKGNPDSKVYHKAQCRHYNAKGSTKEFKSEADAVKAGYKPCKQCATPKKSAEQKQQPQKDSGKAGKK